LPRIVLATVIMGGLITGGDALLTSVLDVSGSSLARTATLGVLVAAGLGVYALCLQAFGVTSVRALHQAIRERF
jgi:peptidoglycan biosynthesis protein MviN/MurJ (putative lipid II flippase)